MKEVFSYSKVPLYCELAQNGTVVVFDTETTGLTSEDDVVQLAYIVMNKGKVITEKSVYLKNQVPINGTQAQQVNGITDEYLATHGEEPDVVLMEFRDLLNSIIEQDKKVLLVAHNLAFDAKMLNIMFGRYGIEGFPKNTIGCCTKEFVKALRLPLSRLPNNKLCTCIEAFKLNASNTHEALADTHACAELFKFLAL